MIKVDIDTDGVLKILPETITELFALKKWYEDNPNFAKESKIFINTDLK